MTALATVAALLLAFAALIAWRVHHRERDAGLAQGPARGRGRADRRRAHRRRQAADRRPTADDVAVRIGPPPAGRRLLGVPCPRRWGDWDDLPSSTSPCPDCGMGRPGHPTAAQVRRREQAAPAPATDTLEPRGPQPARMPTDPPPAAIEAGTWGGVDHGAAKVLVSHQRRDIGSCVCGWGSTPATWGQSHALHVWRELQRVVLPDHDARVRADERARVAEEIRAHADRHAPAGHTLTHPRTVLRRHLLLAARVAEGPLTDDDLAHIAAQVVGLARQLPTPPTGGDHDA